jgi:hypothetical protein
MKKYALPGAVMLVIILVIGGVIACPQTKESKTDEEAAAAAVIIESAPKCNTGYCYSGGYCCPKSTQYYCKDGCYTSSGANSNGCYTLKSICY